VFILLLVVFLQARVLLLQQRELTWQNFPVAEATAVQEIVDSVEETVNVEFDEGTLAADMYTYLEQLEVNMQKYTDAHYSTHPSRMHSHTTSIHIQIDACAYRDKYHHTRTGNRTEAASKLFMHAVIAVMQLYLIVQYIIITIVHVITINVCGNYSQELEAKQTDNEDAIAAINTSMDNTELQKASQDNPDINEEKDRLLDGFTDSKARLAEKLAKIRAQVKAVSWLEAAINKLEECIHHHRAIVLADLPVGPILEVKQEKMKKTGVSC